MSSSLLALIDDIATDLDDGAVRSKVAAQKTAGVQGGWSAGQFVRTNLR